MKFDITLTVDFGEDETEEIKINNFEYPTEEIPEEVIDNLLRKAPRRYRNILLYFWADIKVEIKKSPYLN
jgi:hypothetical protein